jgi:hypothetical protein
MNTMAREFAIATVTSWPPSSYLKEEVPSVLISPCILEAGSDTPQEKHHYYWDCFDRSIEKIPLLETLYYEYWDFSPNPSTMGLRFGKKNI